MLAAASIPRDMPVGLSSGHAYNLFLFRISFTKDIQKMLYLVGLGLADERDITVKGLEVVKRAERVYLEAYTAVLLVDVEVLVRCYYTGPVNIKKVS